MSTHRRVEILCVACVIIACIICVVAYAMSGTMGEDATAGHQMGYEQTLFDTSKVHTIDIVMDDWDGFIENCENEEYATCAVVVDGESYKNVAIRAKGNTSLRNVSQLDSDRYSFKVEFDHYESDRTYHGLDKLSLNNIIQDNTYMKDYLTYAMMNEFGVDSPLASYVNITVNGEDWGLYLAVEGVEDSFLERVHGTDAGELYKPDSMGFGGGRGNGQDFNMDDFMEEQEAEQDTGGSVDNGSANDDAAESSTGSVPDGGPGSGPDGGPGGGGPGGGMGSSDVKLQYIDDDPDSYQNIFNNAKNDVTYADKKRLIESLRKLSSGEDLEDVLNMDEVLRYFVVHDYVCNGDSYTGSMVHNYYLYEKDGKLSMIPWDYNLAFGGFAGGDATSLVNSPIDDPTSSGFGFGGFGGFGRGAQKTEGEEESRTSEDDSVSQAPEGEEMPGGTQMPQMPGGSQMPKMPEGMEMPGGGQMPEGMEMPQMPGGGQMPSGDFQMPEGMELPEGVDMSTDDDASSIPGGQQMPSFGGVSAESDSRPMVDWIFASEDYTKAYHELYQQFLNDVDIQAMINETQELIAPYVERDPTKFCTYEEFLTGVDSLREFCSLRTQSVQGQLDGTIPSTEDGQQENSSALVDASSLTISDMGSMGSGSGSQQGGAQRPNGDSNEGFGAMGKQDSHDSNGFTPPTGGGFDPSVMGNASSGTAPPGGNQSPTIGGWITVGASVVLLACGMGIALVFRH